MADNFLIKLGVEGAEKVKSSVDSVKKSLGDLGGSAKKTAADIDAYADKLDRFTKAGQLLAVGAGVISGVIGLVGRAALKSAGEFERMRVQMETLTGSTKTTKKILDDLYNLAAKTPFEFSPLVGMATKLIGVGVAAEALIPTLTNIGNAAQGNQVDAENMTDAYMKMTAKQSVQMEELNRFTERGLPIMQEMAKVMGLGENGVLQLKKQMESGSVPLFIFNEALNNLTTGAGKFAGGMEKASKTFEGLTSTLSSDVDVLQREFGEQLIPVFKNVITWLDKVVNSIRTMSPENKKMVAAVTLSVGIFAVLTTGLGALLYIIPGVIAGVSSLAVIFGTTATVVSTLTFGIPALISLLVGISVKYDLISKAAKIFKDVVGAISKESSEWASRHPKEVQAIIREYDRLSTMLDSLDKKFKSFDDKISNKLIDSVNKYSKVMGWGQIDFRFNSSETATKKTNTVNTTTDVSATSGTSSADAAAKAAYDKEQKDKAAKLKAAEADKRAKAAADKAKAAYDTAMDQYNMVISKAKVSADITYEYELSKLNEIVAKHATAGQQKVDLETRKNELLAAIRERDSTLKFDQAQKEFDRWLEVERGRRELTFQEELAHYNRLVAAKAVTEQQKREVDDKTHELMRENTRKATERTQEAYDIMKDVFAEFGVSAEKGAKKAAAAILKHYIEGALRQLMVTKVAQIAEATAKAPMSFGATLLAIAPIAAAAIAGEMAINALALADGGLVKSRDGGTFAQIGEAGKDEAVIPLDDPNTIKRIQRTVGVGGSSGGSSVIILAPDGVTTLAKGLYYEIGRMQKNGEVETGRIT